MNLNDGSGLECLFPHVAVEFAREWNRAIVKLTKHGHYDSAASLRMIRDQLIASARASIARSPTRK